MALMHGYGKTPPLVGNAATLVVRGNISLTINIVLSERVTEFSAIVRKQWRLTQILILVATSAFKLRIRDWTILHSKWTLVLLETKLICRPLLSNWQII